LFKLIFDQYWRQILPEILWKPFGAFSCSSSRSSSSPTLLIEELDVEEAVKWQINNFV